MDQITRDVLELVKASLWGTKSSLTAESDWDQISKEMYIQSVLALPGELLPSLNMKDSIRCSWQVFVQQSYYAYLRMMVWQQEIADMLEEAGVCWVLLKGFAAAIYYPNPSLRTMGDMDILIAPEDFDKAEQQLETAGFIRSHPEWEKEDGRHISYHKGSFEVELHRYFVMKTDNQTDVILNEYFSQGMKKAERTTVGNFCFRIMPDLENGLVLLAHVVHHFNKGFGLRQLIDFMMYAHVCLRDKARCEAFEKAAAAAGLDTLARALTQTCTLYLGLPEGIPWSTEVNTSVCEALIDFVMFKGNFGIKKSSADKQVIRASNRLNGNLAEKWAYIEKAGETHWKALQKYPWLRPFRGIYQLCRYAVKALQINNISSIIQGLRQSKKEKALFKELGLP